MARRSLIHINAEVWAESGGTGGVYGKLWSQRRLRIVSRELTSSEQDSLDVAVSANFQQPTVDGD